jgi:hypothetical protein
MAHLFNVTPHPIHLYADQAGKTLIAEIPTSGELRMASEAQPSLAPILVNGKEIPVIAGQRFVGLDASKPGHALWLAHPTAGFIVSLSMAQWLASPAGRAIKGERTLFCPAADTAHAVRNASGTMTGCVALERHD